jgi:two-component system OmpR family sensor kinase
LFNKNSILFTLLVSFIVSILLIIFSFFTLIQKDHFQHKKSIQKRYLSTVNLVLEEYKRIGFTEPLTDVLYDMGFEIVEGKKIYGVLKRDDLKLIKKRKFKNSFLYILKGEDYNYIHITTPFDEYLLIDKKVPKEQYKWVTISIFMFVLGVFFILFYSIYKKLYPLNELKEKIDQIGDEAIEFETINEYGKDEVALLAKEFKNRAKDLKQLKDARNIFIRNIMHELKTPITKGRFLAELPDTKENKEKLKYVFYQLESLINEFASIEEVISKGENIEKKDYFFSDILENALDKLLLEDDKFSCSENDLKLKVNFKLFTIAVKNLIDNGVKYSNNNFINIDINKEQIIFVNQGEKLKYDLKKYFEPFFNSESNDENSFGLGLYIVNSIIEAHGFELLYKYEDNKNIFIIDFKV